MPSAHRRPGALSEQLAQQLATVEPSYDGHMVYRPCRVTVDDGSIHDRVYVVEASPYKQMWGVWPENDPAKVSIAVERLAKIEDSPSRLPAGLATKLYESGESGMGYCMFRLVLANGTVLHCMTGNAVDFIDWPAGVEPVDVVDAIPNSGDARTRPDRVEDADYAWCLYEPEPWRDQVSPSTG